jgi:Mn2+/Fe2+ NRAMP family transporter
LLIASNIGAVIMPWMIFYQQSAVVDKGLKLPDINFARLDTAIGAVATQIIMIAVIVTTAATLYVHHISVTDAAHAALALIPLTGKFSTIIFGAGLIGASMLGAFVVSLATSWAFGEAFQWPCSLNFHCTQAKRFYGFYAAIVVLSAGIVLIPNLPLVKITLYVEAGNAIVLPIVLGFLLVLSNDKKILASRVNSLLGNVVAIGISVVCVALGLWYGVLTLMGQTG